MIPKHMRIDNGQIRLYANGVLFGKSLREKAFLQASRGMHQTLMRQCWLRHCVQ